MRMCAAAKEQVQQEKNLNWQERLKGLITALPSAYWQALTVVSLLYFARFDASFITLRAKTVRCHLMMPIIQTLGCYQLAAVLSAQLCVM